MIYFQALLWLVGGNLSLLQCGTSHRADHDMATGVCRSGRRHLSVFYDLVSESHILLHLMFTTSKSLSQSVLDLGRQGSLGATLQVTYHRLLWGPSGSHLPHMQNRVTPSQSPQVISLQHQLNVQELLI